MEKQEKIYKTSRIIFLGFLVLDLVFYLMTRRGRTFSSYLWGILLLGTVFSGEVFLKSRPIMNFLNPQNQDPVRQEIFQEGATFFPENGRALEVAWDRSLWSEDLLKEESPQDLSLLCLFKEPDLEDTDLESFSPEEVPRGTWDFVFCNNLYGQVYGSENPLKDLTSYLKPGGELVLLDTKPSWPWRGRPAREKLEDLGLLLLSKKSLKSLGIKKTRGRRAILEDGYRALYRKK